MKKSMYGLCLTVLLMFLGTSTSLLASSVNLGVSSVPASPGEIVNIDISVNQSCELVNGAVFTVDYNPNYLVFQSLTSDFFPNFSTYGLETGDSFSYNSSVAGQVSIAAVKLNPTACASGNEVLFTLQFTVKDGVEGQSPITLSHTVLSNTEAGYSDEGEAVPALVSYDPDASIVFTDLSVAFVPGAIYINTGITDRDEDGIEDGWEYENFDTLTEADQTSDSDQDGYSDLTEYLNASSGGTDPDGNAWDPNVENAPYGAGYSGVTSIAPLLMLLLK